MTRARVESSTLSRARMAAWLTAASVASGILIGCLGLPAGSRQAKQGLAEDNKRTPMTETDRKIVSSANVRREGDRVWIEGVSAWTMGERPSSIHAAQAAVMRAVGEEVTYEQLVGASGLAFRMQVHKDLCPSSPHPFCGTQCVAGSNRMLPWKLKVYEVKPDDAAGVAEARKAVVASIDRGVPVQYGSEEDGLIVGYQKAGAEWLAVHPLAGNGKRFVERKWPWGIAVFTGPKAAVPPARELAMDALKQAVRMAHTPDDGKGDYLLGLNAWDYWLGKVEGLIDADEKALKASMMGNSWIYTCLVAHRTVAAGYLRSVSAEFGADSAGHLRAAADLYEKMATQVLTEKDHCALDVAPTPWYLKDGAKWTDAMRRDQITRLTAAVALEKQALAEIELALAAEGVDVPDLSRPAPATRPAGGELKTLSGLRPKPAWITHMGSLIGCAEYLKIDASPGWIWGVSGHAFALNIHETLCPSGPTAWAAEKCDQLAADAGLKVESLSAFKLDKDVADRRKEIWDRTRAAIDAGKPCFGWELDIPEWYVITGYDADGRYRFAGPTGSGSLHYSKLGDTGIGVACVAIVSAGEPADDRRAVREALQFALAHGASRDSRAKYRTGLGGYDAWIKFLQEPDPLKIDANCGHGGSYNAQCWSECRKQAVAFLKEAKTRLDDGKLNSLFDEAINHYTAVSTNLTAVAKAFQFSPGDNKGMDRRMADPALRAKAVGNLQAARTAEAAGLKALARIAVALGAKDVDPDTIGG